MKNKLNFNIHLTIISPAARLRNTGLPDFKEFDAGIQKFGLKQSPCSQVQIFVIRYLNHKTNDKY
jgi:hypothetical protein